MAGGKQSNGHHAAAVGGSGGGASAAGDGSDGGFHYEWMGPPGAAVILLTLPVVVYFLYFACTSAVCLSLQPSSPDFLRVDDPLRDGLLPLLRSLVSVRAVLLYMGWLLLHFALYLVVPGSVVRGCPLDAQGHCLLYPLNGLACAAVSSAVALLLVLTGIIPSTVAYDEWLALVTVSIACSWLLSVYLYLSSLRLDDRSPSSYLSRHGRSGVWVYDFFVGRALNPRLWGVDLKYLCELRPGLVGWLLLDASLLCSQWQRQGWVTASMVLVVFFQAVYVLDALLSEQAILSTMDITTDGFGWMLAFGDLTWVPFTYTLQARYLVDHPVQLSPPLIACITALELLGLYVFRVSNDEKNTFRTAPSSAFTRSARYLQTSSGSRLLLSGWWGRSRHPNYAGDLCMALAWSLTCGFSHPIVYFYPLYFAVLLVHRQRRDDDKCRRKYGKDWDTYCQLVPYRIIPYVY